MDKVSLEASKLNFLKEAFNTSSGRDVNVAGDLAVRIITFLEVLAGAVAIIYLILAGIQYITAGGNTEQANKARQGIVNALIGVAIVVLSYGIVSYIAARASGNIPAPSGGEGSSQQRGGSDGGGGGAPSGGGQGGSGGGPGRIDNPVEGP